MEPCRRLPTIPRPFDWRYIVRGRKYLEPVSLQPNLTRSKWGHRSGSTTSAYGIRCSLHRRGTFLVWVDCGTSASLDPALFSDSVHWNRVQLHLPAVSEFLNRCLQNLCGECHGSSHLSAQSDGCWSPTSCDADG